MTETTLDLEALPVAIKYAGEIPSPWDTDKPRTVDAWTVTIGKQWGTKTPQWVTTYYTGTGLRKNNRPTKPTVADILHSLFMDADAVDMNFSEWCDTFGYSDDSLKALRIYQTCTETGKELRKHFSPTEREQIRAIIQEM